MKSKMTHGHLMIALVFVSVALVGMAILYENAATANPYIDADESLAIARVVLGLTASLEIGTFALWSLLMWRLTRCAGRSGAELDYFPRGKKKRGA